MPKFRLDHIPQLAAKRTVSALALGTLLITAMAHRPVPARHSRLQNMAHTFMRAALPSLGFFLEKDDSITDDGQKFELKLARATTDEQIDIVYRIENTYIPSAVSRLNAFLRDNHTQQIENFDPREFDLLHTVLARLGRIGSSVEVLSGYRSQESNDELRETHIGMQRSFRSTSWQKQWTSVFPASQPAL